MPVFMANLANKLNISNNKLQIINILTNPTQKILFKKAPSRLNSECLTDILYILGFTKEEQEALLEDD
jgi:hypothetical protein